jgi:hypothetical protein
LSIKQDLQTRSRLVRESIARRWKPARRRRIFYVDCGWLQCSQATGRRLGHVCTEQFVDKRYVVLYVIAAVLIFAALEPIFEIYANVVKGLGPNLTLTDITDVW